jgi:adenosylcobinamide kinase / adenosylcobinamide-phosphate guanylyltransferase
MAENITLILGGARSGKSSFAQQLAGETGRRVLYLATALVNDDEMVRRVAAHKASRPREWETLEASENIANALRDNSTQYDCILLDCVTLLLGNMFHNLSDSAGEEDLIRTADEIMRDLILAIDSRTEPWILVTNEVGLGLVPDNLMGRVFRDVQGRANQQLAARADVVYMLAAGIPLKIKG